MKFLLDHDVPMEVAHLLRHWGYEVTLLKDVLPTTTPDTEVFNFAQKHLCHIITCNRAHFSGLAEDFIRAQKPFAGLIILVRRRTRQAECARLRNLLQKAGESGLTGNINFA